MVAIPGPDIVKKSTNFSFGRLTVADSVGTFSLFPSANGIVIPRPVFPSCYLLSSIVGRPVVRFGDLTDLSKRCIVRRGDAQNSYGELMQLAAQASSIVGGMVVPTLIGGYLDYQWGTRFCVLIGIGVGVVLGTVQLLALARRGPKQLGQDSNSPHKPHSTDEPRKVEDEDSDRDAGT